MEDNNQQNELVQNENVKEKKSLKSFGNDLIEIVESTFITIFVIILIFTYLLHPVNVVGKSMVPTLNNEDRIFMSMITNDISCGDIIVINNDSAYLLDGNGEVYASPSDQLNECIIKRVIACGGQEVNIDFETHEITVDGVVLDEPYINAPTARNQGAFEYPFVVPEGYYFVMGDNRNESADSRNPLVGLIKKEQIYGKAVIRYAPLSDFKIL